MNRTHLERAAEALASKHGYAFFAVQDDCSQVNAIKKYPAAVLMPLVFKSCENGPYGRITYGITLRLLRLGAKLPPEGRRAALETLENNLFEIFTELSDDEKVIAVEELQMQPGTCTLTPHGELSQTASARIITCL